MLIALLLSGPAQGDARTSRFEYASDLGVATEAAGAVCLAIARSALTAGTRVQLVVVSASQSIVEAAVVRAASTECPRAPGADSRWHAYPLLISGSLVPGVLAIAVLAS